MKTFKLKYLGLGVAVMGLLTGYEAQAALTYVTPAGSTTSGGNVDAQAVIAVGSGVITIQLTSLEANPGNDSQLVSGISFDINGTLGAVSLASAAGTTATITSGGTYTIGSSTIDGLAPVESGNNINLSIYNAGGGKHDQIIGPDNAGGFNPSLGKYSNANPSILNHEPVILGTGTFTLDLSGVNSDSVLSDVTFLFGTTAGTDQVPGTRQTVPVPEPSTIAAGALLLLPLGLQGIRQLRRQQAA